jgi:hypothetical protein
MNIEVTGHYFPAGFMEKGREVYFCSFVVYFLFFEGDFLRIFLFHVRHSTLFHLPPFRFHCVGGCWDRTQDSCDNGIGCQTLYHSARSHQRGYIVINARFRGLWMAWKK